MFRFKDRCYNGGKRHKFSPRYTEIPMNRALNQSEIILSRNVRGLMVYEKYVGDICEWCGKIIKIKEE